MLRTLSPAAILYSAWSAMTLSPKTLREFEGKSICLRFTDGTQAMGVLISATQDFDGSLHVIYQDINLEEDTSKSVNIDNRVIYVSWETILLIRLIE